MSLSIVQWICSMGTEWVEIKKSNSKMARINCWKDGFIKNCVTRDEYTNTRKKKKNQLNTNQNLLYKERCLPYHANSNRIIQHTCCTAILAVHSRDIIFKGCVEKSQHRDTFHSGKIQNETNFKKHKQKKKRASKKKKQQTCVYTKMKLYGYTTALYMCI